MTLTRNLLQKLLGSKDATLPAWPASWRRTIGNRSAEDAAIIALFSIFGRITGSDGGNRKGIHKDLIAIIRNIYRFQQRDELSALGAFAQGARSDSEAEKQVRQFVQFVRGDATLLEALFSMACHFAVLDGLLGKERKELLAMIAHEAKLEPERAVTILEQRQRAIATKGQAKSDQEVKAGESQKRLRTQFKMTTSTIDRSYAILGSERSDSFDVIRARYRELVFKHHPDRVRGRGGDPKKIEEARIRFQAILRAYEVIKQERTAPKTDES